MTCLCYLLVACRTDHCCVVHLPVLYHPCRVRIRVLTMVCVGMLVGKVVGRFVVVEVVVLRHTTAMLVLHMPPVVAACQMVVTGMAK